MRPDTMTSVWILKIALQLVHITYVMLASLQVLGPPPMLTVSSVWIALLVPLPVASNLWHYLLLKRQGGDVCNPSRLVTSKGLFPFVRHPMYLGDILVVIFLGLSWFNWVSCLIGCLTILAIWRLAQAEDQTLRRRFNEMYPDWFTRTGLILPSR